MLPECLTLLPTQHESGGSDEFCAGAIQHAGRRAHPELNEKPS